MEATFTSQRKVILENLLAGAVLTVKDGMRIARTTELRKHISELKKRGHEIHSEWIQTETGKRIKQYFLTKKGQKTS